MRTNGQRRRPAKIRYAVVGLGHIAQQAVLPAFANAGKNSQLTALISDDAAKLRELSREYDVEHTFNYDDYEVALRSGTFDAVYIALPNSMHCDFTVRAAQAGIHVLCEKPLAVTEDECHEMIEACAHNGVKLMTAYRLHFQRGNLEAIEVLKSGQIGEPRIFNSVFTMQVKPDNIRLKQKTGGGTLYDIGVYCINAARYLFRDEPTEVFAYSTDHSDKRFRQVDEMTSAVLRFPDGRLANFTTSFGAADTAHYEVVGTRGLLRGISAYEYSVPMSLEVTMDGRTRKREYSKSDQFGPELIYFSNCILRDSDPEPSGIEGLIDVHIVRSLYESAKTGLPVQLKALRRRRRPAIRQLIHRPGIQRVKRIHVQSPSK